MGYSIAVRARNQTLKKRMVRFMAENHRKWSDVLGEGESISSRPGLDDEGALDYDHNKLAVGFDYASHCHGWESCLIYSETRWMALKIGALKSKFKKDDVTPNEFEKPVPFMVYDGYQSWPILVVKNLKEAMKLPKSLRWCATDKLGVYIGPEANTILTSYAETLFSDKKAYAGFSKELAKFQSLYGSKNEGSNHAKWVEEHTKLRIKYMGPEINAMLPKVRAEVVRLDALWEKAS